MPSTRTRTGRLTRSVTALAVLFAAVAVPLVGVGTPAYASSSGYVEDPGPGNDSNNTTHGTPTNDQGAGYCQNGQLIYGGKKAFDGAYHNCVGQSLISGQYNKALCMTGFEVYRFYGTVADPTKAVVRGRVNTTSNCATEAMYRFATVNAYDSGQLGSLKAVSTSTRPGMSPWHAQRPANNPDAASIAAHESPNSDLWASTPVWRYLPDSDQYATGKLTDGVVVAQVKGNCASAQTTNSYRQDLDDPAVPEDEKQIIRALLWKMYDALGSDSYALQQLNMARFTRNGKVVDPVTTDPLTANAQGVYPDRFAITWDETACSSPFDYVSSEADPNAGANTVTGVCYIPTMRSARIYKVRDGGEVVSFPDWSSVTSTIEPGGLRYSSFYANTAGSAGQESPGNSGLSSSTARSVASAWRTAMAADYAARVAGNPFATGGGYQTQKAPAQPYTNEQSKYFSASQWNTTAAANALRDDSRCAFGDHASWLSMSKPPTPAPSASLTVKVTAPPAFQVGGLLRVQTITAQAGALLCNGKACGADDRLTMLHYRLAVTGIGGYRQCAAGQQSGCDFAVTLPPSVLTGPTDVQATQEIRVVFYNPTMPTQNVRVTVSGQAASFTHSWSRWTPQVTLTGRSGNPIVMRPEKINGATVVPFTPGVTGAPKNVPVIGAAALPGH